MTNTRVITVGTASAFAEAARGPSSNLLQIDGQNIVVDLGSGALQKLHQLGVPPEAWTALCFTHAHIDHTGDLLSLMFGICVGTIPRSKPLPIYLSEPTFQIVRKMQQAFEPWLLLREDLWQWHVVAPHQQGAIGDTQFETGTVSHSDSSVAFVWTDSQGRRIATPGDTGEHEPLLEFLKDLDLLLIECGCTDEEPLPGIHLSPSTLKELLATVQPKNTAIVHCPPSLDRAQLAKDLERSGLSNIRCPNDLEVFEFPD